MTRVAITVLAAACLASCAKNSEPDGVICTALAAAGLGVTVIDSVTGATSGFTNVSIVVRGGTYKDSVFVPSITPQFRDTIPLAYEHRGTVQLDVRADGYAAWGKNNITITGDVCHVHQEFVSARLVR